MIETFHFTMALPRTPRGNLIVGVLTYCENEKTVNAFQATSGCIGNQFHSCQNRKGKGCLPSHRQAGILHYTISTQKLWLPHVKGVEGSFFAISPFTVNINGVSRGDFGVHFDANVPGSAACVVLETQRGWTAYLKIMDELKQRGRQSVPLYVDYN